MPRVILPPAEGEDVGYIVPRRPSRIPISGAGVKLARVSCRIPRPFLPYPAVRVVTGYYHVDTTGQDPDGCILWDLSAGTNSVQLPTCVSCRGRLITIVRSDTDSANTGIIVPAFAGSDTIAGASSFVLVNQNESVTLQSDGLTTWRVVAHSGGPTSTAGSIFLGRVTVVATADVTTHGHQTIHGVGVTNGSRVLCTAQSSDIDNVIFEVLGTGDDWVIAPECPIGTVLPYGALVYVDAGTDTTLDTFWKMTTGGGPVVGTDSISWSEIKISLVDGVTGVLGPANGGLGNANTGASAYIPIGQGSEFTEQAITGDATLSNAGVLTLAMVGVPKGGTGRSTLTAHGVLIGEGTGAITATAAGTTGQLLIGQASADPAFETMSGDATIDHTGAIDVAKTGGVAFAPSATTDTTNASNITSGTLPTAQLAATTNYRYMAFQFANGGSVLTTGLVNANAAFDGAATLVAVYLTSPDSTSGSATVDIIRANGAVPTSSNSIVGGSGTKPALSSGTYAKDTTFTSWTSTTLAADDIISLNLTAVTSLKYLSVVLVWKVT